MGEKFILYVLMARPEYDSVLLLYSPNRLCLDGYFPPTPKIRPA
ncbi:hypothetical protein MTBLM5_560010 [Magnetospirillum sp. LM-5]|nr:hypothetical protein MTBLM5_560010 [Magnetospirillum sp. LM-5]